MIGRAPFVSEFSRQGHLVTALDVYDLRKISILRDGITDARTPPRRRAS